MASSMKQKQKEIEQKAKEMAQPVIDEYTAKLKQLDDREKKLDEWDASLKELHESVGEADARIREAEEAAREKAIAEIKESEAEIREEEKKNILESADLKAKDTLYDAEKKAEEIVSGAQEKAERLVSDAEEELKKEREQLAADRQEAADARAEAISEKQKAIEERTKQQAEFLENLSRHNESVEQRFNDQFAALTKMRDDLVQRRIDLEDDQADVEEDRKYIQEQKKKYAKSSQAEVDRLNSQLRIVNGDLESKDTLLQEREQEIISLRKMLGETGGKSLEDTVAQLTRERDEALNAVAEFPSSARIAELEQAEKEYQALKSEMKTLTEQKNELERELSLVHFSQNQLDSLRATAQAYEALNGQLQEKLKFISETYKSSLESKFAGLLEIDREKGAGTVRRGGREPKDLTEIVSYVQAYGANRKENPLYYSDETVRVFVASLAASFDASRLLILQGLSGTGKTSLPRLFAEALGLTCDLVSVQPSWRDNRELLGYDNDFTNRFK